MSIPAEIHSSGSIIKYCKRQKLSKKKLCGFRRFLMNRESFHNKCSVQQWLSLALPIQMKQKLQMISLHLDEIQSIAKLFFCLTFVVNGIANELNTRLQAR